MSQVRRNSHVCASQGVEIETYVDGDGPSFVILPSYGRDGGDDFDDITHHLVADGWPASVAEAVVSWAAAQTSEIRWCGQNRVPADIPKKPHSEVVAGQLHEPA